MEYDSIFWRRMFTDPLAAKPIPHGWKELAVLPINFKSEYWILIRRQPQENQPTAGQ